MKAIHILVLLVLAALLLGGCYMAMEQENTGGIALNATVSGRGLIDDGDQPDNEVWIVGFLIDAAYEEELKQTIWLEDRYFSSGNEFITRSDVADAWAELAEQGGVRFSGGMPYFQFPMNRINPEFDDDVGSFTIEGVPAGKSYWLYVMAFEDRIDAVEDLETVPESYSGLHFYNPDWFEAPPEIPGGWNFFTQWDIGEDGGYYLTAYPWLDINDNPFRPKPITVKAGETVSVPLLLVDRFY